MKKERRTNSIIKFKSLKDYAKNMPDNYKFYLKKRINMKSNLKIWFSISKKKKMTSNN